MPPEMVNEKRDLHIDDHRTKITEHAFRKV